jgi:RNA polymerase sigma-70 factor, ECF subfamily
VGYNPEDRERLTVGMPSTLWTAILEVRNQPDRVTDLIVRRYRQPIHDFALQQGLPHEDAEDVTQEVFLRVCREEFLVKADRTKGKFRTLLLAVTKHVIAKFREYALAGKRDRRRQVALGDFEIPDELPSDPAFDRLWVQNLVEQARERLKEDLPVRALMLQFEGKSYRDIGIVLGKKETEVTNYIHRGKERLKREIERLIAEYSAHDDVPDEIATLMSLL